MWHEFLIYMTWYYTSNQIFRACILRCPCNQTSLPPFPLMSLHNPDKLLPGVNRSCLPSCQNQTPSLQKKVFRTPKRPAWTVMQYYNILLRSNSICFLQLVVMNSPCFDLELTWYWLACFENSQSKSLNLPKMLSWLVILFITHFTIYCIHVIFGWHYKLDKFILTK